MNETVTINDNLLKADNLITALEYLLEEVKNRKDNIFNTIDINEIVRSELQADRFMRRLIGYMADEYFTDIYSRVAFQVMEQIDADITRFINDRVDTRLREHGVNPSTRS